MGQNRSKPYRLKEAAEALGIAKSSLHDAVTKGAVPHTRIGRNILISAAWIENAITAESGAPHRQPKAEPKVRGVSLDADSIERILAALDEIRLLLSPQ